MPVLQVVSTKSVLFLFSLCLAPIGVEGSSLVRKHPRLTSTYVDSLKDVAVVDAAAATTRSIHLVEGADVDEAAATMRNVSSSWVQSSETSRPMSRQWQSSNSPTSPESAGVSDDLQATCQCKEVKRAMSENITVLCPEEKEVFAKSLLIFNVLAKPLRAPHCAIVKPASEEQLARALRKLNLDGSLSTVSISVKNGGHQPSGWALSGNIVLDLANLRGVEIDRVQKIARVAAGEKWGAVYNAAAAQGLGVHGATDHAIGVSGISLVGGITFLSKTRGLVANSLVRVRLCLMNGTLLDLHNSSTNSQHRSLFRMFRAGSGVAAMPIGVVTELTFKLFEPEEKYLGYSGSTGQIPFDDAWGLVSDLQERRSRIRDPRLAVDIEFMSVRQGFDVNMMLFFDGPFSEGLNESRVFLERFSAESNISAKPQTFATYSEWTRQHSAPDLAARFHSWHGAFVSERGLEKILKDLRKVQDFRQGVAITFEDRTHTLSRGQEKSKREHALLINYACFGLAPCSLDGWAEDFYDRHFRPHQVAEYLGYMNSPHRHEISQSLSMWRPNALPTLKCWRAALGAGKLTGGVGFSGDTSKWHQESTKIQQSLSQAVVGTHLSSCHTSSFFEDPVHSCDDGNHLLPYHGQVALVIGGTGGIGKEVALLLRQKGAEVVIAARDTSKCKMLSADFWVLGYFIECEAVELTSTDSMRALMKRRPSTSIMFHVAAAKDEALWVNHLSSVFLATELLQQNPRASFIAVGSGAAHQASEGDIQVLLSDGSTAFMGEPFRKYCATKNMQIQALDTLQRDRAADIRIVVPSFTVSTDLVEQMWKDVPKSIRNVISFQDAKSAAVQVVNAGLPRTRFPITGTLCLDGCSQESSCSTSLMEMKQRIWKRSLELLAAVPW
mmetsp:Transcript_109216/g.199004  ORF Transcript_109216/g.199004 Transcript_109216/m.199004 type:complete len:895 (-) Transcript_109216:9-2693(-)